METLNTERLMELQVKQLEKEKKELNERLRIVGKRVDHIERAYRKEERPFLGQDYEEQQTSDRATFEAVQKARIEGSRISHQQNLEAKRRMARMMGDYESRKNDIAARKGDDLAHRKAEAARKIDEEKAKRRKAVLQAREEETKRIEDEERMLKEKEDEEERLEAGMFSKPPPAHVRLTDSFMQSVPLRKSGCVRKRKLNLLLLKQQNVKQRRSLLVNVKSAKLREQQQPRKLVSKCSERKKLRDGENSAGQKNELLLRIQLLLELRMGNHQPGDALLPPLPAHLHLFERQRLLLELRVRRPRSSSPVLLVVLLLLLLLLEAEEDGETEKRQGKPAVVHHLQLLPLDLLLLRWPLDQQGTSQRKTTTAFSQYLRKRSGSQEGCKGSSNTSIYTFMFS